MLYTGYWGVVFGFNTLMTMMFAMQYRILKHLYVVIQMKRGRRAHLSP